MGKRTDGSTIWQLHPPVAEAGTAGRRADRKTMRPLASYGICANNFCSMGRENSNIGRSCHHSFRSFHGILGGSK